MKILTTIYNKVWSSRDNLPDEWKKAIIVPMLKPDKLANLVSSYRPTPLTAILAKIQERMIVARLNWYLENQTLLPEEQAGFRQNRSKTYQPTKLTQEIKRAFNQKESVPAVFVYFSRAYDSIWRAKLVEKLKNMNTEGNTMAWFSRFLDQSWTKVKYGETFSKYKQTKVGLSQRAVTSTTLFNDYINDLPHIVRNTKTNIRMYADDVVIWASTKNNAKQHKPLEQTISTALNSLSKWATENNMEINASKTVYQFFSMRHKNDSVDLKINSQKLPKSESTKYLGVHLDNKRCWKNHVKHTINKVNQRLRLIKRLAEATWGSTQETTNTAYKTYVKQCG